MEIESERAWNQLFSSIKHSRESALSKPIKPSMAQASVRGACGFVLAGQPLGTRLARTKEHVDECLSNLGLTKISPSDVGNSRLADIEATCGFGIRGLQFDGHCVVPAG